MIQYIALLLKSVVLIFYHQRVTLLKSNLTAMIYLGFFCKFYDKIYAENNTLKIIWKYLLSEFKKHS